MMLRKKVFLVGALAASALGAHAARGDNFPAGSLIIPLDECYQYGQAQATRDAWNQTGSSYSSSTTCTESNATTGTPLTNADPYNGVCRIPNSGYPATATGLQHAFGLLYELAINKIPVSVILRQDKESVADYDFTIPAPDATNPAAQYLTCTSSGCTYGNLTGGVPIYYRGAPFVISAAYAQQAIKVLQNGSTTFQNVVLHLAQNSFDAPVASVVQSTPKPIGIIKYSNSNGYNTAIKYLNDAGIITAMGGGEGVAYSTIALKVSGNANVSLSYRWPATSGVSPGATSATPCSSSGTCTGLTYSAGTVSGQRVLDAVWAPDLNQNTCQNILQNPSCFDSSNTCLSDTCVGAAMWCCPTSGLPTGYTGTQTSFVYDNLDGTSTTYYCPCGAAGTSNSSDKCTMQNWQFQGASCYNSNQLQGNGSVPSSGCASGTICNITTQQCLTDCSSTACPTGYTCTAYTDVVQGGVSCASSNKCPSGYTCNSSGTCTASVCVLTNGTTCTGCTSDQYCDVTGTATCKYKWGCSLSCGNCPNSEGKNVNVWANLVSATGGLNAFFTAGGRLLGTDSTALTAETGTTHFLTTSGLASSTGAASGDFCAAGAQTSSNGAASPLVSGYGYPGSNVNIQVGDFLYKALGGNSPSYYVTGSSLFASGVQGMGYYSGSQWYYPVLVGPYNTAGTVIYEGANNYGSSSTSAPLQKIAGQHIIFDTLLNTSGDAAGTGANTTTATELVRSSPIPNNFGAFYLGSFDWKYTTTTQGTGFLEWRPPLGTYPWATGHFREFKKGQAANPLDSSSGVQPTCDNQITSTTSTSNPCAWDATQWIQYYATSATSTYTRKIWAATGSISAGYLLKDFSTSASTADRDAIADSMGLTDANKRAEADAVITYVTSQVNGSTAAFRKFGAVDSSIPAVIEAKPAGQVKTPATATTRPTVAYVGARDGMLHAFCVSSNTGTDASRGTCYSNVPGAELWAMIPPSVLKEMKTACSPTCSGSPTVTCTCSTTGDWSKVAVNGVMHVGDVHDTFSGSPGWRTVLVFGMRQLGAVAAIDISDPNVSNKNADGLKFLWENDGTTVDTSVTPAVTAYTMGPTQGAAIGYPGKDGVAVVTSATHAGTGSGDAQSGLNLYVIRMGSGKVASSVQYTYSRSTRLPPVSSPIPDLVPAMPTILDRDDNTLTETLLVPTMDGVVRRRVIKTDGTLDTSQDYTIFDASQTDNGSATTVARQPISASVSIAKKQSGGYVGLVATGGVDWLKYAGTTDTNGATIQYHIYGIDPSATSAQSPLFTFNFPYNYATTDTPPGDGAPLRIYAQPAIFGTDVYVQGTTLAVSQEKELLQPILNTTTAYGKSMRWALGADVNPTGTDLNGSLLALASGASGGGSGELRLIVTTNADSTQTGSLYISKSTGVSIYTLSSAELLTSKNSATLALGSSSTKTYTVKAWFGGD